MKKVTKKILFWMLIAAIWTGIEKVGIYLLEMQYASKVAPNQVDDDNAYTVLKTQSTSITIIHYLYLVGLLVIIWMIIKTYLKNNKETN